LLFKKGHFGLIHMQNGTKKLKFTKIKSNRFLRQVVRKQNSKIQVALKVIRQGKKKVDSAREVIAKMHLILHESQVYKKVLPQQPIRNIKETLAKQYISIEYGVGREYFGSTRIDAKTAKANVAELVIAITGYCDGEGKHCLSEPSKPFYFYKQRTIVNRFGDKFPIGYDVAGIANPPSERVYNTIYLFDYSAWPPSLKNKMSDKIPTAEYLPVFDGFGIGGLVGECSFYKQLQLKQLITIKFKTK
jgi:hypothetical protein